MKETNDAFAPQLCLLVFGYFFRRHVPWGAGFFVRSVREKSLLRASDSEAWTRDAAHKHSNFQRARIAALPSVCTHVVGKMTPQPLRLQRQRRPTDRVEQG